MREDDPTYYARRAREEAEAALKSAHTHAAAIHRELAQAYRNRVTGPTQPLAA